MTNKSKVWLFRILILILIGVSITSIVYAADGVAQLQIRTQYPIRNIHIIGTNQNNVTVDVNFAFNNSDNVTVYTTWNYWWRIRWFCGWECLFGNYPSPENTGPYVTITYVDGHRSTATRCSNPSIGESANVSGCDFFYVGDDIFDNDNPDNDDDDSSSTPVITYPTAPIPISGVNFDLAQPGDIILVREASNEGWIDDIAWQQTIVYGGYWAHAAIVVDTFDNDGFRHIVQSSRTPGVTRNSITSLYHYRDVLILRVNTSWENRLTAAQYARNQVGILYNDDYFNRGRQDAFYCSQLVWAAYHHTSGIDLDSNLSVSALSAQAIVTESLQPLVPNPFYLPEPTTLSYQDVGAVTPDDIAHSSEVQWLDIATFNNFGEFRRAMIYAFSPVDLYLTGPNGQQIGLHPNSGEVNTIGSGAFYSGSNSEPEFIGLRDLRGSWQLHVIGNDIGDYTLVIEDIDQQHEVINVDGFTEPGVHAIYNINFNNGNAEIAPQDQSPPVTIYELAGVEGEYGWYLSPVTISLSATDQPAFGVGVHQTEYSLDNGLTWQMYNAPFTLSEDGIYYLSYRSTDFVGNTEEIQTVEVKFGVVNADGDGIPDIGDSCLWQGDEDGLGIDETGCPYYDADRDGIYDRFDACPWQGDEDGQSIDETGCPYYDADRDGIYDRFDTCPWQGDEYGFGVDNDGCPIEVSETQEPDIDITEEPFVTESPTSPDNDWDGISNQFDVCPNQGNEGGLGVDSDGCPYYDADWDGVYDRNDQCLIYGNEYGLGVDANGCPIEPDTGENSYVTEEPYTTEEPQ